MPEFAEVVVGGKRCSRCQVVYTGDLQQHFGLRRKSPDGLQYLCRPCTVVSATHYRGLRRAAQVVEAAARPRPVRAPAVRAPRAPADIGLAGVRRLSSELTDGVAPLDSQFVFQQEPAYVADLRIGRFVTAMGVSL